MDTFTAHITGPDGVTRRHALISFHRDDALLEAFSLARSLFPRGGFHFGVRAQ